ncbi:TetR/AcrR family transcriptional regulator [Kitasatospora sp. NPDC059646]|uniref:TetR/AcrR family transcriptional regulator n=1 Tax=Kitasatospora sp. NPDC059646 TaxID=3346893 RepID=UPI0036C74394
MPLRGLRLFALTDRCVGAQQRAALIQAAVDVLVEQGAAAVTPAAVGARTGLARSSFHQYFPSAAALLAALVEESFTAADAATAQALAEVGAPADRIDAFVRTELRIAACGTHRPAKALMRADLPAECVARVHELHHRHCAPLLAAIAELTDGSADTGSDPTAVRALGPRRRTQVRHRGPDRAPTTPRGCGRQGGGMVERQSRWTGFPGRWVGAGSLVAGPVLVLAGVLARWRFDFFFPAQLTAYQEHRRLIAVSYGLVAAGWTLLLPGVALLAGRIAVRRSELAWWGGTLAVLGLCARAFHAGVDHLAFQLAAQRGAAEASAVVGEAYGAFHVFGALNAAIMGGWLVLAYGAWRAGVLGAVRAVALAAGAAMPLGVLKGTTVGSVAAAAGLCLALVPLGAAAWREGPRPAGRTVAGRVLLVATAAGAMVLFGQLG